MRAELIDKYGPYCQICITIHGTTKREAEIDFSQTRRGSKGFSFDHIIALADGGENHIDNMWPAHIACNERKGSEADHALHKRRKPYSRSHSGPRLAYTSSSY